MIRAWSAGVPEDRWTRRVAWSFASRAPAAPLLIARPGFPMLFPNAQRASPVGSAR
jgi:hypothetical protein